MTQSEREQKLRKIITEWAIRFVQLGEADQVKEQLDSKGFIAITIPEIEQFCEELIEEDRKQTLRLMTDVFKEVAKEDVPGQDSHQAVSHLTAFRFDSALRAKLINSWDKALKETTEGVQQ